MKSIVNKIGNTVTQRTQVPQTNSTRKGPFSTQGWNPTPSVLCIALSSVAAVLSVCQSSVAQLNVGGGIPPGLEQEYLQYQMSGQDLSQMRGIPGCVVGFGLTCNKTGSVLNQILESNHKTTYQDLLMRAAGGPENFRNFATFYGNNPNLSQVPYASFWQNDSPAIMDGYRYLLGGPLNPTPVEGLGSVTKNFFWAPLSGADNGLSLRSGLLDLKYSYGRALLEEVSKIPNLNQQIQSMNLPPDMKDFYLSNLSRGLQALKAGNNQQIEHSILNLLSSPYSPAGGEFQRPAIGIPKAFDQVYGEGLPGDQFVAAPPVFLDPDVGSFYIPESAGDVGFLNIPESVGELISTPEAGGFPIWAFGLAGAGGVALLALLLGGGGGDHSSPGSVGSGGSGSLGGGPTDTGSGPGFGPGSGPGPDTTHPGQIDIHSGPSFLPPDQTTVPEASVVKALVLMIIVFWMLSHKHRRTQKRV